MPIPTRLRGLPAALPTALAAAAALTSLPALAQGSAPGQAPAQRVEITGSAIKRLEGETAAPVQVLSRIEIERSGVVTMEQLMRSVAAMVSSNATAAGSSSGATTGGISTISLRGLTAERTLVLINGRRIAPYGAPNSSVAVDVDSIPVAAIERVEILKDGASAIYGSDAIAGVVNFILRRSRRGLELAAGYGAATEDGKGDVTKASVLWGWGDLDSDRFNLLLTAAAQKEGALFGADRDFAARTIRLDKNNNAGSSRTDPGNIAVPGVGVVNPRVDPAAGRGDCGPRSVYLPELNDAICFFDPGPFVGLIPKTERASVNLAARWRAGESLELFAELGWTRKKAQTVIQSSPIDTAFGIPFLLAPASPFYPTAFVQNLTGGATPTVGVRYRPFLIGDRDLTDTATATRLALGATTSAAGWDLDAAVVHATSEVRQRLNGGYFRVADDATGPGIVPLLSGQVRDTSGATLWVNPFGDNSAAVVAAARATNFLGEAFRTETALSSGTLRATREVMALPGGPLALALGLELRRESYRLDSNAALGTGNISGYGGNFVDIDIDRGMQALAAELSAPLTRALQLDASVRHDRYASTSNPGDLSLARAALRTVASAPSGDVLVAADVDRLAAEAGGNAPSFGKTTLKGGLRVRASETLVLRGTFGTGFRAPSLLDLYGPLQAGVSPVINDPANCRGANAGDPNFCATQFSTFGGGNSRLQPESSSSYTAGFVYEPTPGWSAGVDWFSTNVKNLIGVQSAAFLLENEGRVPGKVLRGPSNEIIAIDQRLENLGRARIAGIDLDLRGQLRGGFGRLGLGWSATYMSKWLAQTPDGTYLSSIGQTSRAVTGYIPRWRHSTQLSLDRGTWGAAMQYHWQSGGLDTCGNTLQDAFGNCPPGSNPRFGAYATLDVQGRWQATPWLGLSAGVRNLLDKDPPYVNGSGGAFQGGYDPTYVDPRGRFAYLQAVLTLR